MCYQDGHGVLDLVVLALRDWEEGFCAKGGQLQAFAYKCLEGLS